MNSKNKGNPKYPTTLDINEKGVPICIGGHEMVYNGFEKSRSRLKWRCPLVLKKVDSCSCQKQCSPSPYGRVIYTKPSWDLRLFTPVPRGSKQWKTIYKTRTCSERINNRILNDYRIHSLRIHGKERYSFMTMIAAINIHLDARLKVSGFSILNLLE
nr:transposase [Clostridium putrefaciens]